tara:strand:+ start:1511 stop:1882 length:372 start_codon:yes stop_codon:yes gene_type:complete
VLQYKGDKVGVKRCCGALKKMTSQEVKDIINKELEGQTDLSNAHGVNLNDCLIEPKKESYLSSVDESITLELWTVLEETADRSGYKITFDETYSTFGLGIMTEKDELMDIGTYGTFIETLKGM